MTHILIEKAKIEQALEALEANVGSYHPLRRNAITSLRQAITTEESSATQEPVALETVYETIIHWDEGGGKRSRRELARRIAALYTHPQPKAEQIDAEWLARRTEASFEAGRQQGMKQERALWELARIGQEIEAEQEPKREWVGLTDEEIFDTHKKVDSMQYLSFAKAIEAKLKEKNTCNQ